MASILSFKPRIYDDRKPAKPPGEVASVIIFPGVRYEKIKPNYAGMSNVAMATEPSQPASRP